MKKKILISCLLAGIMALSCACSNDDDDDDDEKESSSVSESAEESSDESSEEETAEQAEESETEEPDSENAEASEAETPVANAGSADISDDIFSFEIALDGETYTVPLSYSDFAGKGWVMDGDDSEEIKSNQYSLSQKFENGDFTVNCQVINLDEDTKALSECYIGQIKVDTFYTKDTNHTVQLPKGIVIGTATMDDVTAAYGEPDDKYEGDSITTYTYKEETYKEVKITFDTATKG